MRRASLKLKFVRGARGWEASVIPDQIQTGCTLVTPPSTGTLRERRAYIRVDTARAQRIVLLNHAREFGRLGFWYGSYIVQKVLHILRAHFHVCAHI